MSEARLFTFAGVLLSVVGLLILSTGFSLNSWLLLSGTLTLYLGLRFLWRYSSLHARAKNGYFIFLFGSIFLIIIHLSWWVFSFFDRLPDQSMLQVTSGELVNFKIVTLGNKSETFLSVELNPESRNFRISGYDLGRPALERIVKQFTTGAEIKAWLACHPEWKCKAYRLVLNNRELFSLDTITEYHQSVWRRISKSLLFLTLIGLLTIIVELVYKRSASKDSNDSD
jgi:hypothetical protein